ncbi:AlpA family transcriptional regulator [Mesorhizobium sp. ZC-5]|uniref:AlpA family transcriptional regulator n=1 Tax=Mesorhizobium sp. ZC-5 TaxID=2986066 RepID=UPI0021E905B0|nr:AlpA family transcriptional regulator [Mesorhizobium sp. ZC-5]MCV3243476.1 AlpA family transcriptional regulator [Mesorhizobium sp. ZC-5]
MKELKEVKGISYSKSQIYRLMREGKFPHSIAIGENRIEFLEPEIDGWIMVKILERNANLKAAGEIEGSGTAS